VTGHKKNRKLTQDSLPEPRKLNRGDKGSALTDNTDGTDSCENIEPRMDWQALASILGEHLDLPLALLDGSGRIRVFNRSMERALGWRRFEVEGEAWSQLFSLPGRELETERWIGEALRGVLQNHEVTAVRKSGAKVVFRFDFTLVGRGWGQGLLMSAAQFRKEEAEAQALIGRELDYEILLKGRDLGSMVRLCAGGETVPLTEPDPRCHSAIYGLAYPCEDCPVLETDTTWPRTQIRLRTRSEDNQSDPHFEVATAEKVDSSRVRVRLRVISESAVTAIQGARIQRLAEQAALTPREREVLRYLLLGRNIAEIAKLVGISARTVKHHQASVLRKMGADSRTDLIRLIL
jgi:PAS domain S-box-containing protein